MARKKARGSRKVQLGSSNRPRDTLTALAAQHRANVIYLRPPEPVWHFEEIGREEVQRAPFLLIQLHRCRWHATACANDGGFIVAEHLTSQLALGLGRAWKALGGRVAFEPDELDPAYGRRG